MRAPQLKWKTLDNIPMGDDRALTIWYASGDHSIDGAAYSWYANVQELAEGVGARLVVVIAGRRQTSTHKSIESARTVARRRFCKFCANVREQKAR
jgi:hypothetical protein